MSPSCATRYLLRSTALGTCVRNRSLLSETVCPSDRVMRHCKANEKKSHSGTSPLVAVPHVGLQCELMYEAEHGETSASA